MQVLSPRSIVHLDADARTRCVWKRNGAVSKDCAEPHENPNLTLDYLTRKRGIRSNGSEEKARAIHGAFASSRISGWNYGANCGTFGRETSCAVGLALFGQIHSDQDDKCRRTG